MLEGVFAHRGEFSIGFAATMAVVRLRIATRPQHPLSVVKRAVSSEHRSSGPPSKPAQNFPQQRFALVFKDSAKVT